mgnify:CR=1 FL=1
MLLPLVRKSGKQHAHSAAHVEHTPAGQRLDETELRPNAEQALLGFLVGTADRTVRIGRFLPVLVELRALGFCALAPGEVAGDLCHRFVPWVPRRNRPTFRGVLAGQSSQYGHAKRRRNSQVLRGRLVGWVGTRGKGGADAFAGYPLPAPTARLTACLSTVASARLPPSRTARSS